VRLVAAAVARRSAQDEELVEEVRLAVGEACALMIGENVAELDNGSASGPVVITMDVADRLRVQVTTQGPVAVETPLSPVDGMQPWALLRGLIDDLELTTEGSSTRVSMSWPLA
jgi:hypothetical protein